MSKYKRLTSDTGFARNLPINEEMYDRLYELENAIENGTLIELPCEVEGIAKTNYYEQIINSVIDKRLEECHKEHGATPFCREMLRELAITRFALIAAFRAKDEFAECRDCPAWSGSDCTRHPYNEGCLKEDE